MEGHIIVLRASRTRGRSGMSSVAVSGPLTQNQKENGITNHPLAHGRLRREPFLHLPHDNQQTRTRAQTGIRRCPRLIHLPLAPQDPVFERCYFVFARRERPRVRIRLG
jgi:hypothetical protein